MKKGIYETMRETESVEPVVKRLIEVSNGIVRSFMPCPTEDLPMLAAILERIGERLMEEASKAESIKDADGVKRMTRVLLEMAMGEQVVKIPSALVDAAGQKERDKP